jgi:O-antigen/teichoic acid export membrane protein
MDVGAVAKSWSERVGLLRWSGRSSVVQRLAHGTFWLLTGTVTWRVLTAVSTIFVARILGGPAFGELAMIRSTVDLFVVFGCFRLGSTAAKYVSQYRKVDPPRAGAILLLVSIASLITCLVTAILCLVLSPWMAQDLFDRPDIRPLMALSALLIFFATFSAIQEVALSGFEAFKANALLSTFRGLSAIAFCVPLALLWGIKGVIISLLLDSVIALVICLAVLWKECVKQGVPLRIPRAKVLAEAPVLWRFALPGVLAGLIMTGTMWVGRVILVHRADGFMQLGLFAAANQWRTPMLFLPSVLCRVMLPLVSESYSTAKTGDLQTTITVNLKVICMTALPICLAIMCLANFIQGLYGEEFRQSAAILRILMPAVFLYAVDRVFERVFEGTGRRWTDMALTAGWSAIFSVVALIAVPGLGGIGLALAFLCAQILLLVGRIVYVERALVPGSATQSVRLLVSCLAVLAVAYVGSSYAAHEFLF